MPGFLSVRSASVVYLADGSVLMRCARAFQGITSRVVVVGSASRAPTFFTPGPVDEVGNLAPTGNRATIR